MKAISIFLLLCMLGFTAQAQMVLSGVSLPVKLTHDKEELVLNGGGIRKQMLFKVYVAGLYLSAKNKNGHDICGVDKPEALRIQITSGLVNSKNMSQAIREGFNQSTGGTIAPLKERIEAFIHTFDKEKISEGDIFDIWYLPGVGIKTFKNNQLKGVIQGFDFKKALFGIWLSDAPVDNRLKKALLGF